MLGMTNLVSNAGVVASDVAAVGTGRRYLAACSYGVDKGIFGFGNDGSITGVTNLVSNAGVVASDVAAVGTARSNPAACSYGQDFLGYRNKGIFGFGLTTGVVSLTNLVSDTGVVASDTTGVGTVRKSLAACGYGKGKGIFGFGEDGSAAEVGMTNLVSNIGVVATDVTAVGTGRSVLGACSFN
jgi:PII-like signaling protein